MIRISGCEGNSIEAAEGNKSMKKIFLSLLFFVMAFTPIFAISPPRISFSIENFSSSTVVVNVEFWCGPGSNLASETTWYQTINGITLRITDLMGVHRRDIHPNRFIHIIRYYAGFHEFEEMIAIPIMDKLSATFKRFEIIRYDGKALITLECLGEMELGKTFIGRGFVLYILQIFDCDV